MTEVKLTKLEEGKVVKEMTKTFGNPITAEGDVLLGRGVPIEGEVTVSLGRTINTGNFESLRIDVRTTLPNDPELRDKAQAHTTETFKAALKEAENFLNRMEANFV